MLAGVPSWARAGDGMESKHPAASSPPRATRTSLPHRPGGRIPESLAAVVQKAMALDPAARYPRTEDLQADILA